MTAIHISKSLNCILLKNGMKNVFRLLDQRFIFYYFQQDYRICPTPMSFILNTYLCLLPITFRISMFPKVIINSLKFRLITGHYLDQWFPTDVNGPLGTLWKSVDLLVVTIIWVAREAFGGWGLVILEVLISMWRLCTTKNCLHPSKRELFWTVRR